MTGALCIKIFFWRLKKFVELTSENTRIPVHVFNMSVITCQTHLSVIMETDLIGLGVSVECIKSLNTLTSSLKVQLKVGILEQFRKRVQAAVLFFILNPFYKSLFRFRN